MIAEVKYVLFLRPQCKKKMSKFNLSFYNHYLFLIPDVKGLFPELIPSDIHIIKSPVQEGAIFRPFQRFKDFLSIFIQRMEYFRVGINVCLQFLV